MITAKFSVWMTRHLNHDKCKVCNGKLKCEKSKEVLNRILREQDKK